MSMPEYSSPGVRAVPMSQRAHFWIRIAGLALILAAEFGPKLWSSAQAAASGPIETAAETR